MNSLEKKLEGLQKVEDITNELLKAEQIEIPVKHYFCNGIYARQIDIPSGSFITGKIHKHGNLAQLVKGTMRLISGTQVVGEITAPCMFISEPGTARVALTLSDCIFITYHNIDPSLDESDMEEIEQYLGCDSLAEYEEYLKVGQDKEFKLCH